MTVPVKPLLVGHLIKGLLMVFNVGNAAETMTPAAIKEALSAYEICPSRLMENSPSYPISVEYAAGSVNFGTNFTELQIRDPPTKLSWPVEEKLMKENKLFTLLLYGADVPTREHPITEYHWSHWIIINIPGNKWKEGRVVTEYRAWQPFYTNDIHRCIFLVYPQKDLKPIVYNDTIVKVKSKDDYRGFFNKDDFAKKYNLEEPYAINFFQMHLNESYEDGNVW